jgi:beta-dihydromenaquinone-9 omega-hydroxylase
LVDQHSIGTRRAELEQETTSWARWCITARPIRQSSTKPPLLYEQCQDHAAISAELREPRVSSSIETVYIGLTRTEHQSGSVRLAYLRAVPEPYVLFNAGSAMRGTRFTSVTEQGGVPQGACPLGGGNILRTGDGVPAPTDKAVRGRLPSRAGFPVSARLWRDARLARIYGPVLVTALARNVSGKARARLVGKRDLKHVQITDFDPLDPAIAADPYPHYGMLLAGERVQYNPKHDVYILSRYADVREAARNDDVLSSARGVTFSRLRLPFLPTSDPPVHTRMRKQLAPGFTRGALESWRPMIDHLARELVAGLLTQTPADVVSAVAAPIPMRTITHILGITGPDQAAFCRLSNQAVRITDVNLSASGLLSLAQSFNGFRHLHAFFTDRLRNDGLLGQHTVLGKLTVHAEHGRLSDEELFFFALLLLVAGYESTANLLSTLFLTLADYPDQLGLLAQRPELIPSAIEEQLRFASPIQNICRTTRVDYPVGRAVIPAGSLVLLAWGAANRDPRQYDDPDVFRSDRNPVGHLAFGSGIHLCPGAQLARMEGQAVLREIVDNIDRIEVVEPPAWSTNANLRGLTRLRVAVTRRAPASCVAHV